MTPRRSWEMRHQAIRRLSAILPLVALLVLAETALSPIAEAARLEVMPAASEARYRVREQLLGYKFPNDAVGTTQSVSGAVAFDVQGRPAPGSKIIVDLRTLRSDEARRDNYLHRDTLTTASFPYAEFIPREVRGLPFPLPASGRANVQILGNLTIRGVTRPVTWEGTVEFTGTAVRLQARTAFKFGDFELTQPRVFRVLSIEDHIRLEVDLTLRQAS